MDLNNILWLTKKIDLCWTVSNVKLILIIYYVIFQFHYAKPKRSEVIEFTDKHRQTDRHA